jgi:hypothetical protein
LENKESSRSKKHTDPQPAEPIKRDREKRDDKSSQLETNETPLHQNDGHNRPTAATPTQNPKAKKPITKQVPPRPENPPQSGGGKVRELKEASKKEQPSLSNGLKNDQEHSLLPNCHPRPYNYRYYPKPDEVELGARENRKENIPIAPKFEDAVRSCQTKTDKNGATTHTCGFLTASIILSVLLLI